MSIDESRITRVTVPTIFQVMARDECDSFYAKHFTTLDEALASVENDRHSAYAITEMRTVAFVAPRAATADEIAEDARITRMFTARQESWNAAKAELGAFKFSYEDPISNEIFLREMGKRGYPRASL